MGTFLRNVTLYLKQTVAERVEVLYRVLLDECLVSRIEAVSCLAPAGG